MTVKEANRLVRKYIRLREKIKTSTDKKLKEEFKKHENLCIQKFKHLVLMKTSKYKNFSNYEDLNQEGLEAIARALTTYNPKRGNIFWWIHKYVDTRIARSANQHSTIRFPLKYSKTIAPHRESALPILIDQVSSPQECVEHKELLRVIKNSFANLSTNQQEVIQMLFGIDNGNPQSISKVCNNLNISRPSCMKILDQVFSILKKDI